jgi:hypothetical protein
VTARGLRYSSAAAMPDGMRQAAERALGRHAAVPQPAEKGDARRKYGNHPTTVDGIRFDSKREARYYEQLQLEKAAGLVLYFLRQVPLHLPGGTRLVVDFLVVMVDGRIRYVDAKGRETQAFRIKRREIQHHYPITVELV